ncbi:hypothetical protein OG897_06235 [Streptomyces sp. NBC_00237]|uniref:hypothetical protein n=1 Tax=Streptomyces sp. NBC_00237 TaxID=2975687 RepID=UPI0022527B54|nr:hypothetical protein [Streptomyces sp. NBC_00237]MCX5201060.1 hypothetical protein [Streptomyces sp. NBC_00237]
MTTAYSGPGALSLPDEDGVTTVPVHVDLTVDPVTGEWRGTCEPTGPLTLTYEPVELTLPGGTPTPAHLLEGVRLEIYGSGTPPWDYGRS